MRIDVLLPTVNRLPSLIMTLSGLAGQTLTDFHVILADQSDAPVLEDGVIQTLLRIISARGGSHEYHHRVRSQGIAEQRHFLLERATSPAVLYLDDDVFLEPWVLAKMLAVLEEQGCAFVGAFPAGLTFRHDIRPAQQVLEFWEDGRVRPEVVEPEGAGWQRWHLHRAANLWHASHGLANGAEPHAVQDEPLAPELSTVRPYKVAWIASCILYDRAKLLSVGGFAFWSRLPRYHSGEEVLVQNLLMRRYGGCGIAPSGAYYSQLPSTVLNDAGTVDGHALSLLPEMVARYCSPWAGDPPAAVRA